MENTKTLQGETTFHKKIIFRLSTLFLLTFFTFLYIHHQLGFLIGIDSYYHSKMGWIVKSYLALTDFPWLAHTPLKENFINHHFLFHLLFAPFTSGDLLIGSFYFIALSLALLFSLFYLCLEDKSVPFVFIFTIVTIFSSSGYLYRLNMMRAQLWMNIFLLGIIFCLLKRKLKTLALLSFLSVYVVQSFVLIYPISFLYCFSSLIEKYRENSSDEETADKSWKQVFTPFGIVVLASMFGMIFHPYFPEVISFYWEHFAQVKKYDVLNPGGEYTPFASWVLWEVANIAWLFFGIGTFLAVISSRISSKTIFLFLNACFFAFLVIKARRFIEYTPLMLMLFSAYSWSDFLAPYPAQLKRYLLLPTLLLSLVFGLAINLPDFLGQARYDQKEIYSYEKAAQWLSQNAPPESIVFHPDWDDFPRLFFYNHNNYYITGLNPLWILKEKRQIYQLLREGKIMNPGQTIGKVFQASYAFVDRDHKAFIEKAQTDPRMNCVYRDEVSLIYAITP